MNLQLVHFSLLKSQINFSAKSGHTASDAYFSRGRIGNFGNSNFQQFVELKRSNGINSEFQLKSYILKWGLHQLI